MKIDITTSATPTGAEEFKIDYNVEGQNFGYVGYGTSAAKSLTLSFWVKSNVTGTYRVNFLNYYYVLYKLCELLNENTFLPFFPMLKDPIKRIEQDTIWKKICSELHWEFVPTI